MPGLWLVSLIALEFDAHPSYNGIYDTIMLTITKMRKLTFQLFLALVLVSLLFVLASPKPAQAQAGTAYDLIAAVNAYRSANDLAAYGVDSTLMSLAQAQSNYQASIGTCTHQRADSSGPGGGRNEAR